jgi:putative addiction module component (TIGR02574 family)
MPQPQIDPASLTIEERLLLIDELWLSIAKDARRGDAEASAALDLNRPPEPELLAELERRFEAFKRDPSRGVRWEDLRAELNRKYG